jgi:hypothetical protein
MPTLPAFDPTKNVNHSPHVVILGAGASKAAFPSGDANGRTVPVMAELTDCLELRTLLGAAGFADGADFESIYDELASSGRCPSLLADIDSRLRAYFEALTLPEKPTLYDYLLLSLREKDIIATFNWDPFLARAFMRNRKAASLPEIAFLHGNVEIAVCAKDRVKGFRGQACVKCGERLQPTRLLYPVRNKNYTSEPFVAGEWAILGDFLHEGYMLTIFGYAAPSTDAAAVELMSHRWAENPTFELGQVNVVDIRPRRELEANWERFFCRDHYGFHRELRTTWLLRFPRRSCEALTMATLQQAPWRDNPFPRFETLAELHAWIAPLIAEEHAGYFSGKPCIS